jgi:hypothetical protein
VQKIKIVAYVLIFLSAGTSFNELFKIPILMHHYAEHVSQDEQLTFGDFVALHYNNDNQHKDDHGDHQSLPFKSSIPQTSLVEPHAQPITWSVALGIQISNNSNWASFVESNVSNPYLDSFWQPPCVA